MTLFIVTLIGAFIGGAIVFAIAYLFGLPLRNHLNISKETHVYTAGMFAIVSAVNVIGILMLEAI